MHQTNEMKQHQRILSNITPTFLSTIPIYNQLHLTPTPPPPRPSLIHLKKLRNESRAASRGQLTPAAFHCPLIGIIASDLSGGARTFISPDKFICSFARRYLEA